MVLNSGRIEQVGSPLELYHRPDNIFVAGFIGSPKMNFIPVSVTSIKDKSAVLQLPGGVQVALPLSGTVPAAGSRLSLGIRPEHFELGNNTGGVIEARIHAAEHLGSETMFYAALADGSEISVKAGGLASSKVGDVLRLAVPLDACHLFDESGKTLHNGDLMR